MSRPSRHVLPTNTRERLAYDFTRAQPLRDLYPQLAEVRVEFDSRTEPCVRLRRRRSPIFPRRADSSATPAPAIAAAANSIFPLMLPSWPPRRDRSAIGA